MSDFSKESSNLKQLRRQIDDLDSHILRLLSQRMLLVQKISKLKRREGKDPLDLTREQAIFRRLARENKGPMPWGAVKKIFGEILTASRDIQSTREAADQQSPQGRER